MVCLSVTGITETIVDEVGLVVRDRQLDHRVYMMLDTLPSVTCNEYRYGKNITSGHVVESSLAEVFEGENVFLDVNK